MDVLALPGRVRRLACMGAGYVGGPTMAVLADVWRRGDSESTNGGSEVEAVLRAGREAGWADQLLGGAAGATPLGVLPLRDWEIERVVVADVDSGRVDAWNAGQPPIVEPGLPELVARNLRQKGQPGRPGSVLEFTTDIRDTVADADIIFLAVATPSSAEGRHDLSAYIAAARSIAEYATRPVVVVEKSTVPVHTAARLLKVLRETWIKRMQSNRGGDDPVAAQFAHFEDSALAAAALRMFEVISNPEFLAEGTAVNDILKSDRVLIGHADSETGRHAAALVAGLYLRWLPAQRLIFTGLWSAELGKLASNALLAQRLSSVNALSMLCDASSSDISDLTRVVGSDPRIGARYLRPGIGFGGSCLGKDLRGLVYLCRTFKLDQVADYWDSVLRMNDAQRRRFPELVANTLALDIRPGTGLDDTVEGFAICVWGVSFKAGTADLRESPAIDVCRQLLSSTFSVKRLQIFDPQVKRADIEVAFAGDENRVVVCASATEAARNCDAVVVLTEWPEFQGSDAFWLEAQQVASAKPLPVFDGRNFLDRDQLEKCACRLYALGRPSEGLGTTDVAVDQDVVNVERVLSGPFTGTNGTVVASVSNPDERLRDENEALRDENKQLRLEVEKLREQLAAKGKE
jgi:UDPglucose 6-dehydrogenase